jgi:hypothetical protein
MAAIVVDNALLPLRAVSELTRARSLIAPARQQTSDVLPADGADVNRIVSVLAAAWQRDPRSLALFERPCASLRPGLLE